MKYNGHVKREDCHEYELPNGAKLIRCPECKNHGKQVEGRGDCKTTIEYSDGKIGQCMCYAKEHK